VDLSPHYLAIAKARAEDSKGKDGGSRLFRDAQFIHSPAELTHEAVGTAAVDLVYSQFLFHELPADASRTILKSVAKALRPGKNYFKFLYTVS
jgi:SAM-dependent methyltransferase